MSDQEYILDEMFKEDEEEEINFPKASLKQEIEPTFNLVMLLDRSGSMQTIWEEAIGGVNSFIEDQRSEGGHVTFSLIQFDNHYGDPQYWLKDLKDVEFLSKKTYIPRGQTALFDAIGKTIAHTRELRAKGEMIGKVQFIIQTDGHENCSREFTTKDSIKQLIDEIHKEEWGKVIFLGADVDAFDESGNLGIDRGTTMSYTKDSIGTRNAYAFASVRAKAFRYGDDLDQDVITDMQRNAAHGIDITKVTSDLDKKIKRDKND